MAQPIKTVILMRYFSHIRYKDESMNKPDSTFKFCARCQAETERYSFGRCKPCGKASSKAFRAKNLETTRATAAAWATANRERKNAHYAKWASANPDFVKMARTKYYSVHREDILAYKIERHKNNPEESRIKTQNRRARKRANGGTLSKGLSAKLFTLQRGMCYCCNLPLGDDYHLDHWIPIKLGGPNTDSNMRLLRAVCNRQKGAKHPEVFMANTNLNENA
jgi:hypothetical protein